jgi:hypothetical protein
MRAAAALDEHRRALGFAAWPCLQPIAGANSRTDRLAAALAVRSSVDGSTCW